MRHLRGPRLDICLIGAHGRGATQVGKRGASEDNSTNGGKCALGEGVQQRTARETRIAQPRHPFEKPGHYTSKRCRDKLAGDLFVIRNE